MESETREGAFNTLRGEGALPGAFMSEQQFEDEVMTRVSDHIVHTIESKREFLGMSKAELSRRSGIGEVTLGTMLRGKRSIYADEAVVLCVCLGINPIELVPPELMKRYSELWG